MKRNDGPHQSAQRRRRGQHRDFSAHRRDMQAEVAALTGEVAALTLNKQTDKATIRELEELVGKQEKEMGELQEKSNQGLDKNNTKERQPNKEVTNGRNNSEAREKAKTDKIVDLISKLREEKEKALECEAQLHLAQTEIQKANTTISRQANELEATKLAKKHDDEKTKATISHLAYELEGMKRATQKDNEKHRNLQLKFGELKIQYDALKYAVDETEKTADQKKDKM